MAPHAILAIAGALSGTLGSILTAFSLNGVLPVLRFAQDCIDLTTQELATDQRGIHVFTGLDRLFSKARSRASKIVWLGAVLLAVGFVLQTSSVLVR
jgi:hypothetical protein